MAHGVSAEHLLVLGGSVPQRDGRALPPGYRAAPAAVLCPGGADRLAPGSRVREYPCVRRLPPAPAQGRRAANLFLLHARVIFCGAGWRHPAAHYTILIILELQEAQL